MKLNFDKPRILYACDRCCTKLSRAGEQCPRCHNGKGEQVDPVPRELPREKNRFNLCSGVKRLHKHSPKKN